MMLPAPQAQEEQLPLLLCDTMLARICCYQPVFYEKG